MEILYLSAYPEEYFDELQQIAIQQISQPSQKFNYLMIRGFLKNGCNISAINTVDQLAKSKKINFDDVRKIEENGVKYYFLPTANGIEIDKKVIKKDLYDFLQVWIIEHPNTIIVVDVLKPFVLNVFNWAKKNKVTIVSIVTDLPEHIYFSTNIRSFVRKKIKIINFNRMIKYSNSYIFLTEKMNKRLNTNNKPYVIVEGLSDYEQKIENVGKKKKPFICLYSGALHSRYGLDQLVQAFTNPDIKNVELHLYGNGDYVNEIEDIAKSHSNIKYMGIVDNKTIIEKQKEASLLINPRPIDEEYTQYSFPSKNMEYMLSGTPLLTTNLPGMPNEYREFVYLLNNNSSKAISEEISRISLFDEAERATMGLRAQHYVYEQKNNVVQTRRIIEMLMELK